MVARFCFDNDVSGTSGAANSPLCQNMPKKPCLKTAFSVRNRDELVLRFSDLMESVSEAGSDPCTVPTVFVERGGTFRAETQKSASPFSHEHNIMRQCYAWQKAKDLAHASYVDQPCDFGWPVVWTASKVFVLGPHSDPTKTLITDMEMPVILHDDEAHERFQTFSYNYDHVGYVPDHLRRGDLGPYAQLLKSCGSGAAGTASATWSDTTCTSTTATTPVTTSATNTGPDAKPKTKTNTSGTRHLRAPIATTPAKAAWFDDIVDHHFTADGSVPQVPRLPAAATVTSCTTPTSCVTEWLVDTGCGYDLVDMTDCKELVHLSQKTDRPMVFDTAGGEVTADRVLPMRVDAIKANISPYLLESTPNVLSVGLRCEMFGWGFFWPAWSRRPFFIDPDGKRITLTTCGHVPYLRPRAPCCFRYSVQRWE